MFYAGFDEKHTEVEMDIGLWKIRRELVTVASAETLCNVVLGVK